MRTAERMVSSAWPNEVAKLATSAPQRAACRATSEGARGAERKGCRRDLDCEPGIMCIGAVPDGSWLGTCGAPTVAMSTVSATPNVTGFIDSLIAATRVIGVGERCDDRQGICHVGLGGCPDRGQSIGIEPPTNKLFVVRGEPLRDEPRIGPGVCRCIEPSLPCRLIGGAADRAEDRGTPNIAQKIARRARERHKIVDAVETDA